MPDPSLGATWAATDLPQLLKHDGSYFAAMVYVRNYLPPYNREYIDTVILANNNKARAWIGDPQKYSDSATIEVWGAGAYVEVMEAASARETNGLMTLRVPTLGPTTGGTDYLVAFDMPPMSRAYPRREGFIQVFTVDVENIQVLGSS